MTGFLRFLMRMLHWLVERGYAGGGIRSDQFTGIHLGPRYALLADLSVVRGCGLHSWSLALLHSCYTGSGGDGRQVTDLLHAEWFKSFFLSIATRLILVRKTWTLYSEASSHLSP